MVRRLVVPLKILLVVGMFVAWFPVLPQASVMAQTALNESFDSGTLPQGWRLVRYNNTTIDWSFANPGNRTNQTGGTGNFAIIDSDQANRVPVDAELQTPQLDFSGTPTVRLTFRSYFRSYEQTSEKINVDVSGDGGNTWATVYSKTDSQSGLVTLDISAQAANKSNVIVAFRYFDANYSWYWQIDDVKIEGIGAPAAPTNLSATTNGSQIALSWTDASTNETSFRVERATSSGGPFTEISGTSRDSTSYADSSGLSCNTAYYYRVRARNASGDSAYSNVANATTAACAGLSTLNESFTATSAPAGWTTTDLSNGSGATWNFDDAAQRQFLGVGSNNLVNIEGLNVSSTNAALRTPILDLSGSPGVILTFKTWIQRNSYRSSKATIDYSLDGGNTWATAATFTSDYRNTNPIQALQVDMSRFIGGKTNVVIRFNLVGAATWSLDDIALTANSGAPSVPANVTAVAGSGTNPSVLISWQTVGTGVTYELRKSFDNTNWSAPATISNGATSFSDGGVEAGRTYYYQVRARNANGTSSYSTSAQVTLGGGSGGGSNTSQVFNVTVSYYDSTGNAAAKRTAIENNLRYFADAVYEMTNGAHKIGRVTIYTNGAHSDNVDIKWVSSCWPNAHISGRSFPSGRILHCDTFSNTDFMNGDQAHRTGGYTLAHEWGHYAYSLYDEYRSGSTSSDPSSPQANDTPVQFSIMNSQYNAVGGDNRWINFSTSVNNNSPTNAQYRAYQASAWDTLKRPVSQDPRSGSLSSLSTRLYYSDLAAVAPAAGQMPSIELPAAQATARDQLQFVWSPALSGLQSDDPSAPAQQAIPSIARQIVIDLSRSLSASQLQDVQQVIGEIIERAEPGDQISIVTYDDTATTAQPLTTISDEASRDALIATVDNLTSGSGEPVMGAALETALTNLTSAGLDTNGTPVAVYLFAHGEFSGTPHPVNVIPDYQSATVPIYAFGLSGEDASISTLQTLAQETGGAFRLAGTPDKLFDGVESAEQDLSPIVDVNIDTDYVLLTDTEPTEIPFYIDDTLGTIEVEVAYLGDLTTASFELIDPTDNALPITDCEVEAGDDDFDQITVCYSEVEDVAPGEWLLLGTTSEPEVDMLYWIGSVIDKDDTSTFQAYIELPHGEMVTYPEPVVVRASVSQQFPVTDIDVVATIEGPDGSFEVFELADDGVAPDDMAQDGFYSGLLDYTVEGDYLITVYFDNFARTGKFSEYSTEFAPAPDGSTRDPQLTPVGQDFQRFAETQVNVVGVQEDDHADWFDDSPTVLSFDSPGTAGRIDFADDVDVFEITVPEGATGDVVVRIDNMAFGMDPYIYAFAADESWEVEEFLDVEPTTDDYLLVSVPATAGQTFYVEVYHFIEDAETGIYRISAGTRTDSEQVAASSGLDQKDTIVRANTVYLPWIVR
jgi:uncharacterized protein YegL